MKRPLIFAVAAVLLSCGGAAYVNREPLTLDYLGARTLKRTLAEQQALLQPFIQISTPTVGAAPYPAVIQFHGCAGYSADFMDQWAKRATDLGFAVIAVDSNSPRGLDRETALSSVCKGKLLLGQERAGDVVAALDIALQRDDIDKAHIVLAGWSHGAWSVMDYLALTAAGKRPPSLRDAPTPAGIAGAVLFYPYCGAGTWSRVHRWKADVDTLAFVAGKDTVVDGAECRGRFEKLRRDGAAIDLIYYENADHVFDNESLVGGPYEHYYDADYAADAARRYDAYLERVRARR